MSMRVSSTQIINNSLLGIQQSYSQLNTAQSQLDTGLQLQQPSDNPAGTQQVLDFQERVAEITQYSKNIDSAKGFLSTIDSALGTVSNLTQQARSLVVQGATGTVDQTTQSALATQLGTIIKQIASVGNTTYGAQYVFSGQRTNTAPLQSGASGYTYAGGTAATGDAALNYQIGRNQTVQVNVTGDQVFVPLLNTLTKAQNDIAGGSTVAASADLAQIDTQLTTVLNAQGDAGSKVNLLTQTQQSQALSQQNYTKDISNIEDANLPKTIVALQTAQTAYTAALTATSRTFQNSLLDFLK